VPVNYIAGRDLLLMMVFLTAALLIYVRMRRAGDTVTGWCAVMVLLTLSMLSKANATVAFALVLLFEFLLFGARATDWRPWVRVGAIGALCSVFVWTTFVLRDASSGLRSVAASDVLDYPLTQLKLHLFHYSRNFIWPFLIRRLPFVEPVKSLLDLGAMVGGGFVLATLCLAWFLSVRPGTS